MVYYNIDLSPFLRDMSMNTSTWQWFGTLNRELYLSSRRPTAVRRAMSSVIKHDKGT